MATIQERTTKAGTAYRVLIRLKGYPEQQATFQRKTDAKRWATQTEAAIREGRHFKTTEAKKHTVNDLIERYINTILPQKPKSQAKQTAQLTFWQTAIGAYALADITPALISEWRDKLLKETTYRKTQRSPSTVNRYLAALSHAFTIAVKEWGWIESNPVSNIRKLTEPRGRVRFLSETERSALLEACKASACPDLYLIVVLLLSTGARRMEILSLHWQDVNLARKAIVLDQTKNNERRVLPLASHAFELMQIKMSVRPLHTDLLFPSKTDPSKPIDIRFHWEQAVKEASLNDFRLHDLRHSAASYLAMNGASLNEIAEVLGHKTLQMVKRYAHLSDTHVAGVR